MVVLPPMVVAELISGARRPRDRQAIVDLVADLPLHEAPPEHRVRVGDLRGRLAARRVPVSTPDAHGAPCALDRDAILRSRDAVFARIADVVHLRVRAR